MIVYVDVDETLIQASGVPIMKTVDKVYQLHARGHKLYCWSSGGGDYARKVAEKLGIASLFLSFLPKPHALIDDQGFMGRMFTPEELDQLDA